MYDTHTVAHEIKYPWWRTMPWGKDKTRRWHDTFITIWHVDPERHDKAMVYRRGDDTCGWFHPPLTIADRDRIKEMGKEQFRFLFRRRAVTADGDPSGTACICNEPSTYDAIYWAWRAIKNLDTKYVWQYGNRRNFLTAAELEEIYGLLANPMDNFQVTVAEINSAEACGNFFVLIYNCYRRFNRQWWHHPRWHVHHWRIQIHPWQKLRRWLFSRCAACGGRFAYGESPVSHQWDSEKPKLFRGEVGIYHSRCSRIFHAPAAENGAYHQETMSS